MDIFTKLWANPVIKTVLVTAAGGALGAIEPMIMTGAIILNAATVHMAIVGAVTAVCGLYIKHPLAAPATPPPPAKQP